MFKTKKKKIQEYLQNISDGHKTAFDLLLSDYINGTMKEKLSATGLQKIELYIDWIDNEKCIDIQGRYGNYYVESQIYPHEFSVSFDQNEADDDVIHSLTDKEQVYQMISDTVHKIKKKAKNGPDR